LIVRTKAFGVERHLRFARRIADRIIEECLSGFRFPLDFPNASIGQVIWFLSERRNECRAEPLNSVVGLSTKIAVVEGNYVGALMSAVTCFFRVFMTVPIDGEHVLPAFPRAVFDLHPHTAVLQAIKRGAGDLKTETIPELEPIQRDDRRIDFVADGM